MVGGVAVIVCSCACLSRPNGRARSKFWPSFLQASGSGCWRCVVGMPDTSITTGVSGVEDQEHIVYRNMFMYTPHEHSQTRMDFRIGRGGRGRGRFPLH